MAIYMICKNDAILWRTHIIGFFCKLLENMCSVDPNFNNLTPVRSLKLLMDTHFLACSTQQQIFATTSQKLPRANLTAVSWK